MDSRDVILSIFYIFSFPNVFPFSWNEVSRIGSLIMIKQFSRWVRVGAVL